MGSSRFIALGIAAAAAGAATMWPAAAQCRLCDQPTTTRSSGASGDDIELQIEAGLDFHQLVLLGEGAGAATIRPDGSSAGEGVIANVGPRAMVGSVVVRGEAGRAVRVELPPRVELFSVSGGRIAVEDLASDLPAAPRLDSTGRLTFRFGGRVRITGDADGQYRGDLPITVEYL